MLCLFKGLIKTAAIGGAVLATAAGGAALLGDTRAQAIVSQVREGVLSQIDAAVDDPMALKAELQRLEKEYPQRIATVRTDLTGLQEDVRRINRERQVSQRVTDLAQADLEILEPQLQAVLERTRMEGPAVARRVAITTEDAVMSFNYASQKAKQLEQLILSHQDRVAGADHDLVYLDSQVERFQGLLTELEGEQAQFQTQILQLSRQVDSIERNSRLIKLLERRQRTFNECSRYNASTVGQIQGQVESIRAEQEARLDLLTARRAETDYEEIARRQVVEETSVPETIVQESAGSF
ncbi:MAG: hypothetical protein ACI8QC_001624 [Planctomycetota bacterium]|jgi:hypothetical protein